MYVEIERLLFLRDMLNDAPQLTEANLGGAGHDR
jgi:hypothetical protein